MAETLAYVEWEADRDLLSMGRRLWSCVGPYSWRSASSGCTAAARRAGK